VRSTVLRNQATECQMTQVKNQMTQAKRKSRIKRGSLGQGVKTVDQCWPPYRQRRWHVAIDATNARGTTRCDACAARRG
jgi:hypothetical protein